MLYLEDYLEWREEQRKRYIPKEEVKLMLEDYIEFREQTRERFRPKERPPPTRPNLADEWEQDPKTFPTPSYLRYYKSEFNHLTFDRIVDTKSQSYNSLRANVWNYFRIRDNPQNLKFASAYLQFLCTGEI